MSIPKRLSQSARNLPSPNTTANGEALPARELALRREICAGLRALREQLRGPSLDEVRALKSAAPTVEPLLLEDWPA